jgi:hypothetical protein
MTGLIGRPRRSAQRPDFRCRPAAMTGYNPHMGTDLPHDDATAPSPDATCCVVLTPPGAAVHERLRSRLADRHWRATVFDDPFLAMAELCLREHARLSRAARGQAGAEPSALVLTGPAAGGGLGRLRDMFEAVRHYLPETSIWLYANEELLPLAGARISDAREAGAAQARRERAEPAPAVPPMPTYPPKALRLTEPLSGAVPAHADGDEEEEAADAEDTSRRITAEEIEMLFEREQDEHSVT